MKQNLSLQKRARLDKNLIRYSGYLNVVIVLSMGSAKKKPMTRKEREEKRKWLGKNGRRRVLNEFTWENIAEKTLGLYEQIIKR